MIPDPLDADPMEKFALENPLQPLDPEEALASPIGEETHELVEKERNRSRQGRSSRDVGSKPRAETPLDSPDFGQSPMRWDDDDKNSDNRALKLEVGQSLPDMVLVSDDPNQAPTAPSHVARDISVLQYGRDSPSVPALPAGSPDPSAFFISQLLDPYDGENRPVRSDDGSLFFAQAEFGDGDSGRKKNPIDIYRVRTGRINKSRGHKPASLTSISRSEVTNTSRATQPAAQLGGLTSRLNTILSFMGPLEKEVERLPPRGESMRRNFLEKQASSLSDELEAIAEDLRKSVSGISASGVSAGSLDGDSCMRS